MFLRSTRLLTRCKGQAYQAWSKGLFDQWTIARSAGQTNITAERTQGLRVAGSARDGVHVPLPRVAHLRHVDWHVRHL